MLGGLFAVYTRRHSYDFGLPVGGNTRHLLKIDSRPQILSFQNVQRVLSCFSLLILVLILKSGSFNLFGLYEGHPDIETHKLSLVLRMRLFQNHQKPFYQLQVSLLSASVSHATRSRKIHEADFEKVAEPAVTWRLRDATCHQCKGSTVKCLNQAINGRWWENKRNNTQT